jgi:hypothetical protein
VDEWRKIRLGRAPEFEFATKTDVFVFEILEFVGDGSGRGKRLDLLGSEAEDRLELCDAIFELFDVSLTLRSMACLGAGVSRANRDVL